MRVCEYEWDGVVGMHVHAVESVDSGLRTLPMAGNGDCSEFVAFSWWMSQPVEEVVEDYLSDAAWHLGSKKWVKRGEELIRAEYDKEEKT